MRNVSARSTISGTPKMLNLMDTYAFEVNFVHKLELIKMSGNPVPLTSGSLSIPSSELMGNENEFGVVQSPYQESYMIGHSRQNTLMEPWEKSAIKPIELFKDTPRLPDLPESKPIPDVVITESTKEMSTLSRNRSVPKMMHIYDEYHEEMFQLDDECDDIMPDVAMFPSLMNRKMSRSTDDLNPSKNQISTEPESSCHKHLQKFRSDSNLHSGDSNMSLVEKVSLLNLTATKKDIKSSSPTPLLQGNSEDRLGEGNSTLKRWLLTKPVTVSKREMNAIAPFPS